MAVIHPEWSQRDRAGRIRRHVAAHAVAWHVVVFALVAVGLQVWIGSGLHRLVFP